MFRVKSAWSKAGVGTSVVLDTDTEDTGGKSTRIVFDIGATPVIDDAFPSSTVIISHGHVDHIGGMFSHARAHSVAYGGSTPSTYYVPAALVPKLEEARKAMSSIDAFNAGSEGCRSESLLNMNIVGVNSGDEIELKLRKVSGGKQLLLRAFAVDHCGHPALGYSIVSRRSPGLKPEYQGLPGDRIRDLVKSGVQIKGDPIEAIEVTYTGDTAVGGIVKRDCPNSTESLGDKYLNQAFTAPLIICEATFLEPDMQELARSKGHMNIEDVSTALSSHGWGDASEDISRRLVLLHISSRHRPAERAMKLILKQLPDHIIQHCDVAISALLSEEERRENQTFMNMIRTSGCISLKEFAANSV